MSSSVGKTASSARVGDARALAVRDAELSAPRGAEELIGQSPALMKLKSQLAQFADSPFPVLIEGESGSGKELIARALHRLSQRENNPLYALNCAAISPAASRPLPIATPICARGLGARATGRRSTRPCQSESCLTASLWSPA